MPPRKPASKPATDTPDQQSDDQQTDLPDPDTTDQPDTDTQAVHQIAKPPAKVPASDQGCAVQVINQSNQDLFLQPRKQSIKKGASARYACDSQEAARTLMEYCRAVNLAQKRDVLRAFIVGS
ncbi:MAG: hypothetical protein VXW65_00320 [Pseudomonadota bacterium]|nr:hypothetical protein [Pseudomonadota bacterium]